MIGVLIDLTAKATLLCLAAAVVTLAMRRASAASRHLVWTGFFIAVLALPIARVLLPTLPVFVLAPTVQPRVTPPPIEVTTSAPAILESTPVTDASLPIMPAADRLVAPSVASSSFALGDVVAILWVGGAILLLARIGLGRIRVRRLGRRATAVTEYRILNRVRELRSRFRIGRPIAVRTSADDWMPMTWGVARPVILLPAAAVPAADELPAALDAMLVHEVAHVARLDAASETLTRTIVAAGWFHPLLWLAARQARLERERACDDAVLACGSKPSDYASQLLTLVDSSTPLRAGASHTLAMARPSQLEHRMRSILNAHTNRRTASGLSRWVAALLVLIAVPGAAVQLAARPSELAPAPDIVSAAPVPVSSPINSITATSLAPRRSTRRAQLTETPPSVQTAAAPQVPGGAGPCATPDPFARMGGGNCVNGGWLPPSPAGNYVIGVDDVLVIAVWRAPDVSGEVRVKADGTIRLATGNDVRAAGQTTEQLRSNIRAVLLPFYPQPEVFVQVKQINSRLVYAPAGSVQNTQELAAAAQRRDEQMKMLEQVIKIAERLQRDMFTKIEIGTAAPLDKAGPENTLAELQKVMMALRNAPVATEAEMVDIRSRWIKALRDIEAAVVRFDNGLLTWQQVDGTLITAALAATGKLSITLPVGDTAQVRFVTRSGTNVLNPPVAPFMRDAMVQTPRAYTDVELRDALKAAATMSPDSTRADLLLTLSGRYAFTPDMVALYVAAANGIVSDSDRARVFAQPIRVKGK